MDSFGSWSDTLHARADVRHAGIATLCRLVQLLLELLPARANIVIPPLPAALNEFRNTRSAISAGKGAWRTRS